MHVFMWMLNKPIIRPCTYTTCSATDFSEHRSKMYACVHVDAQQTNSTAMYIHCTLIGWLVSRSICCHDWTCCCSVGSFGSSVRCCGSLLQLLVSGGSLVGSWGVPFGSLGDPFCLIPFQVTWFRVTFEAISGCRNLRYM
jgi:hypothetical protein